MKFLYCLMGIFLTQNIWALNREAYEFLSLEELEAQGGDSQSLYPLEEIPDEIKGDLDIIENSYHLNRLAPYRPSSEHSPEEVNENLEPAENNEENFFGDVDLLAEKYSEIRGRIPPRPPIKYPGHWKRATKPEVLSEGFVQVRLKVGAPIYNEKNQFLFKIKNSKYAFASRAHDSDKMVYLSDREGEFRFKTTRDSVEDISSLTEKRADPQKFQMYDSYRDKDFFDRKSYLLTGLHFGPLIESAPYLKFPNSEQTPYAQGLELESTLFLPWRLPFYLGLRGRYSYLKFQNLPNYQASSHTMTLGPEIRYRWIGAETHDSSGANLLLNIYRSIYSKTLLSNSETQNLDNGTTYRFTKIGWRIGLEIQNKNAWGHSLIGFKGGQEYLDLNQASSDKRSSRENQFAWIFAISYGQELSFEI